jgi:hypothetical protein
MSEATGVSIELPLYKCHKEVRALKISFIEAVANGDLLITPSDVGYGQFRVDAKYVPKHDAARPRVGWYWVRYSDSYESFSTADAFEEGYTLIGGKP